MDSNNQPPADPGIEIGADPRLAVPAVRAILEQVESKKRQGLYPPVQLRETAFLEIKDLRDETEFLGHILSIMKHSWQIDMGDFDIVPRPGLRGRIEVLVKRAVWSLLRFYTFRMFSQQREFNAQASAALRALNERIERLQSRRPGPGA